LDRYKQHYRDYEIKKQNNKLKEIEKEIERKREERAQKY